MLPVTYHLWSKQPYYSSGTTSFSKLMHWKWAQNCTSSIVLEVCQQLFNSCQTPSFLQSFLHACFSDLPVLKCAKRTRVSQFAQISCICKALQVRLHCSWTEKDLHCKDENITDSVAFFCFHCMPTWYPDTPTNPHNLIDLKYLCFFSLAGG